MGRYSAVRGRRLNSYEQAMERFAASRPGTWLFLHLFNPADRRLLPLTRGRFSLALGAPVGLLETVGARSGARRVTPVLYVAHGDDNLIVASNGGRGRDPAWLHNLRARPDVRFLSRERGWSAYRARVPAGADRDALWRLLTDFYAGYAVYQERAGDREIPVVVLEAATARASARGSPS